jgi:hypothetical protein
VKDPGVDAKWDCGTQWYFCFKDAKDLGLGIPVDNRSVEVPACFTGNPLVPCLPGHGKCPRTPCQECNARYPKCEGHCRAAQATGGKAGQGGFSNKPIC